MKSIRSAALITALVGAIGCIGAGPAQANEPWWSVRTVTAPPAKASGEAQIVVEVVNLGDARANNYHEAVTVAEKLPTGITATKMYGEGASDMGWYENYFSKCSVETVTCTFALPAYPYERFQMVIDLKVEPGAGNGQGEVSVSGGIAPPVNVHQALDLEGPPQAYGIHEYELRPEEEGGGLDTQAGSHPFQLTTSFMLNLQAMHTIGYTGEHVESLPRGLTRDLRFNLPAGLIGNPTPLPQCNPATFLAQVNSVPVPGNGRTECAESSQVGVASVSIQKNCCVQQAPLVFTAPVYNLTPGHGEPARFGFAVGEGSSRGVPVIMDTSVRTGGDYGVVVSVPNVSEAVTFLGAQVTFWGSPSDPRHDLSRGLCVYEGFEDTFYGLAEHRCKTAAAPPFLIMPSACGAPPQSTMEADSWSDAGAFAPKGYTMHNSEGREVSLDGCNRLSFEPSINVTPDSENGDTPTGLTVGVHVPQEAGLSPTGTADSAVQDTRVTLPAGVALNPAGADGLLSCATTLVGLQSPEAPQCPEAAKIGTVTVNTPLLPNPLKGAAYIAQQNANPFSSLLAMYITVYDEVAGVRVKLAGEVTADQNTGQLTATFKETPDLPFEDLKLEFFGGSRAPLSTPSLCGAYTSTASIAPWSGNSAVDSSSTFQIGHGPNGVPCANPLPFSPSLNVGSSNLQAAEFTPFTMTMSREDGNQNLDALTLHMPPGLAGTLAGVELCPEPQANEGLCGPNSQIGETTISVGVGSNPYTVRGGKVFLTGPYKGAPFGLSIVNPAKAGPFDVEHDTSNPAYMPACDCVVVRAKVEVDPTTAALTITSDTTGPHRIPTILDGIPLQIKHVNVTINRQNFMFNPTSCEKMAITGDLTSSEGAVQSISVPFQATNCATLSFEPQFAVSTAAHASRTNGTSLHVKLTYPNVPYDKRTNVAKVRVELPKQLPSRLSTLQKACPDTVFNQNPNNCPAASRVGEAVATTPVIAEDFRGPAYFVSHGGVRFPELIIVLHGYSLTVELHGETYISKAGVTSTTFNSVPDVPIGTFELNLPAGPDSALAANGDLCAQKLVMPTRFTAQNGDVIEEDAPISVQGCVPEIRVLRHKVSGKTATIVVQVPSAGTLSAGGIGLSHVSKSIGGAGTVTVTLRLSKRDQHFVASHHGRRLMAPIKLSFTPRHGKKLKATVAVLMR